MAKRIAGRKTKKPAKSAAKKAAPKKSAKKQAAPKRPKPSSSKKAAAKKAARQKAAELEAIAIAQAAEQTAAATLAFAPAPFEVVTDPSKAPGKQHRHPPQSLHGVKHSEAYIAKARTPFNRRMNIGR